MERAIAIKRLTKLLGRKLAWRIDNRAPSADERAAALAALPKARAERDETRKRCEERYRAILAGDAEYQSLLAARKAADAAVNELFGVSRHFKITVGTNEGLFFFNKAEGDSWEDVIDKLTHKQRQAA